MLADAGNAHGGAGFSRDGRWVAYTEPTPHRPGPAMAYDLRAQRQVRLADAARVVGWLADGRVAILGDDGALEAIMPGDPARTRLADRAVQAVAAAHAPHAVFADAAGALWTVRPGAAPARTAASLQANAHLLSVSANGAFVSFEEVLPAPFPATPSRRTGVIDLATGQVLLACERECTWLVIR